MTTTPYGPGADGTAPAGGVIDPAELFTACPPPDYDRLRQVVQDFDRLAVEHAARTGDPRPWYPVTVIPGKVPPDRCHPSGEAGKPTHKAIDHKQPAFWEPVRDWEGKPTQGPLKAQALPWKRREAVQKLDAVLAAIDAAQAAGLPIGLGLVFHGDGGGVAFDVDRKAWPAGAAGDQAFTADVASLWQWAGRNGCYVETTPGGGFHVIGARPAAAPKLPAKFALSGSAIASAGEVRGGGRNGFLVIAPTFRAGKPAPYDAVTPPAVVTFPAVLAALGVVLPPVEAPQPPATSPPGNGHQPPAAAAQAIPQGNGNGKPPMPPRPLAELERLVSAYPTILKDNKQREEALKFICGLTRCMEAIGKGKDDAIALASKYHPGAADTFGQAETWDFKEHSVDSFIAQCREKGVDVTRHDLGQRQEPPAGWDDDEPPPTRDDYQPPAWAPQVAPASPYAGLLALALGAAEKGDINREVEIRAEIMQRFKRADAQITADLFKLLTARESEGKQHKGDRSKGVDLKNVAGLEFAVDGFIPANDQAVLDATSGAGKTLAAIALSFAVLNGTGFLDRSAPTAPGDVLFIASDSGASPFRLAMEHLGYLEHPAVASDHPGEGSPRLVVWAHEQEQGQEAWEASLRGCLQLLETVKAGNFRLVVIDSCKAVTSMAGLDYCNNTQVTCLLTFFKKVICPHTAVLWINHNGTERGSTAGAKAWREVPSVTHSIEKVMEERDEFGQYAKKEERQDVRRWICRKSRLGGERSFLYGFDRDLGELRIEPEVEVVGDCREAVLSVLRAALQRGETSLSRQQVVRQVYEVHRAPQGTVDNTLGRITAGKAPEVVKPRRGRYALAPRLAQAAAHHGSQVAGGPAAPPAETPLNYAPPSREEIPQTQVTDSDLASSRQFHAGKTHETQNKTTEALCKFTPENGVNSTFSSGGQGSGHLHSHGEAPLKGNQAPEPPWLADLLALRAASPESHPASLVLGLSPHWGTITGRQAAAALAAWDRQQGAT